VTRAQAGLAPPNPARLSHRTDKPWGVTKHHSASSPPRTAMDSIALWRELQREAMSGNNPNHVQFGDIEYNVGFDDFGQILIGRDTQWVGAHATSSNNVANRMTFGIAFLGMDPTTPAAMEALRAYAWCASASFGHAAIMLGHQDWARWGGIPTACPGQVLEHSHP
jgi:hypothetical protein